jgi:DNA-directed RNA polymerase specialized sigma24 family protein
VRSRDARSEWVQGHLAEAARIATLLTADPERGPLVAEESIAAALQLVPRRSRHARFADALLTQLVRRSRAEAPAPADLSEGFATLRAVPRRQRAALVLRHYADLSEDRAAMFLDCSPRAVEDLVRRALRALPPEARADAHDWLDDLPPPRPAPPARAEKPLLRRILQPRVLRTAAALAAVAAGVVGGLRIPALLEQPEEPTRAERLAEIRQVLESREASLPFDPDDAGPGATRMFPVVDGVIGGNLWNVSGYRNASGLPCLQLVVDYEFGSRRCVGPATAPIRALVDVDRNHDATFISGMVAPGVAELHFVGPGVSWMDVTIGREDPLRVKEPGFFGIALPGEFVSVDPREAARDQDYEVIPGRLTAIDADGKKVAGLSLLLAEA